VAEENHIAEEKRQEEVKKEAARLKKLSEDQEIARKKI
jgi:hypothetical protein